MKMEYFRLCQSRKMNNVFPVEGLDTQVYVANPTQEQFQKLPQSIVTYFSYRNDYEVSDYLVAPTPMVSDGLRKVFAMYEPQMKFKSIQCYADKEEDIYKMAPAFYVYYIERTACLHKDSVIAPNGGVSQLVLDKNRMNRSDIMVIDGIPEKITIVSLAVAESILRRNMFGIDFQEVEIK
ncbi:MAG: hypothetical protein IJF03_12050 [Lachnospiraceae bacterium]|nr:hypothetical protein [Lachnospiraceae bacterium]